MSRTYLVQMPAAEARHLAGVGPATPGSAEARALAAVREWLAGLARRRSATVPVRKIVADLDGLLTLAPPPCRGPVRGLFGPPGGGRPPMPGQAEYLGEGTVRLDEAAITALASLAPGEDFRVTRTAAGPVLTVGADAYLASEEQPQLTLRGHPAPRPGR